MQQDAASTYLGPSLVIAGAGAGKTRVLTFRIAHILEQGIPAHKILALTFTNKAAKEMKERIVSLVGEEKGRSLWMGTFHSIFAKILRYEADKIGYPSNFTIYDTIDSKNLVKSIIKDLKLDDKTYKPSEILARISAAKNNLITPQAYANDAQAIERDKATKKPETGRIYKIYAQRCFRSGVMDFDDLLLNTNVLFRDHKDVIEKYQQRFSFILVDEYQDTNFSQYVIINKLAQKHRNICVVGDDAQSIYSFRGAKIENILNFKNDYPDYKLFKLEQNYRSTKNIVNAANSLIAKNKNRINKTVWSDNESGEKIKVVQAKTDNEEGFIIANSIFDHRLIHHDDYSEFAILYRTNAQSRIFEEALRKKNIPYKIYGGISFYQRKEIKDLLAYFRLVINPSDEEALKRIINYPARGIGKTTLDKIEQFAVQTNNYIWNVISNIDKYELGLNSRSISNLKQFTLLIKQFQAYLLKSDAYELAFHIASNSGILKDLYNDKTPEGVSRHENVQEILNGIKNFTEQNAEHQQETVTLDRYVENVALLTNDDNDKDEDQDKVTLMTIHSAKGLEFGNVYIVGVEQDLFPSSFASTSAAELEEERRLFYVALTRAKKKVTISYANSRYRWGTPTECQPSRFIREVDSSFIDWNEKEEKYNLFERRASENAPKGNFNFRAAKQVVSNAISETDPSFQADDPSRIKTGMTVEHARFGLGKVLSIDENMSGHKAVVFFKTAGQKQLLLKFAKLRIVN